MGATEQLALGSSGSVFRPIHYLGCKLRILEILDGVIRTVDPSGGPLLDLFSGSGVVAANFVPRRRVVAADIQEYARVLAAALLSREVPSGDEVEELLLAVSQHSDDGIAELVDLERDAIVRAEAGDAERLCAVVEHGSVAGHAIEPAATDVALASALERAARRVPTGCDTVLTRYYGGVYFSYQQAHLLDRLAHAVRGFKQPLRDVGLAAVMSTASEIVSSVGSQFAQPLRPRDRDGRPKREALRAIIRRRGLAPPELFAVWLRRYAQLARPDNEGLAVRGDFADILADPPEAVSVIYADPPYTRDHYSRYYHVLETIAQGDEPKLSRMRLGDEERLSRGLYRLERHQSPFCVKSQAPGAFYTLIAGARDLGVPLVMSYSPHGEGSASRPRLMTIDEIVQIAGELYTRVTVVPTGALAHSKLNASRLNSDVVYDAELLIVCTE